jgi:hypothetical protein
MQASGVFPFGFPDHRDYQDSHCKAQSPFNLYTPSTAKDQALHPPRPSQSLKAAFGLQEMIVKAYINAKLKYRTDKLVAYPL